MCSRFIDYEHPCFEKSSDFLALATILEIREKTSHNPDIPGRQIYSVDKIFNELYILLPVPHLLS